MPQFNQVHSGEVMMFLRTSASVLHTCPEDVFQLHAAKDRTIRGESHKTRAHKTSRVLS